MKRYSPENRNIVASSIMLLVTICICATSCRVRNAKPGDDADKKVDTLITEKDYARLFDDLNLNGNFFFTDDKNLIRADSLTYNLMNKITRMSVAMPDSGADGFRFKWYWAKACSDEIQSYLKVTTKRDISTLNEQDIDIASKNILSLIGEYQAGGQQEMNAYSYVSSTLADYKVLKTYQDIQQCCTNTTERSAIYNDFVAWTRLVSETMSMFSDKIQGDGHYTMAPMEYSMAYESLYGCRLDELHQEMDILNGKRVFTDTAFNWVIEKDFKQQQLWYENYGRDQDRQLGNLDETDEVYQALDEWMKLRESTAKSIKDAKKRQSYLKYSDKIRFDVLRLLMNKVTYMDAPSKVIYGVIKERSEIRKKGSKYNNYIRDKGKFIYFDDCLFDYDDLSFIGNGVEIAKIRNGRILETFKNKIGDTDEEG